VSDCETAPQLLARAARIRRHANAFDDVEFATRLQMLAEELEARAGGTPATRRLPPQEVSSDNAPAGSGT
jgi:hypothetical protein